MADSGNSYSLLVKKLDQFIRKYYVNQIIRGSLYFVGLVLLMFLLFNVLEYYFYFSKSIRKALFFSFIGISLVSLYYWIFRPLSAYFKLGKSISHEQAASIIGIHFSDVKDKLLNILQLKKQSDSSNNELIAASIDQKSAEIKLVPFKNAIDLGQNKKYLKYALPPFLLFLFLLFAAPSMIKDSTYRIINNDQNFEREAPFYLRLAEKDHEVVQYSDYSLRVKVEGEVLPSEVLIDVNGYPYNLKKISANTFEYQFKNVVKNTPFKIYSGKVNGPEGTLKVLKKPELSEFSVYLNYPNYTGSQDERIENIGDLSVPVGTQITWNLKGNETDEMSMSFDNKKEVLKQSEKGEFSLRKRILKDLPYTLFLSNKRIPTPDSFLYNLQVIPDQHPSIEVEKFVDSTQQNMVFFVGMASDDYGMERLNFNYTINNPESRQSKTEVVPLKMTNTKSTKYDYTLNIEKLGLKPGDQLSYYFEVYDNDKIHGSKSAKTAIMNFSKPSRKELKQKAQKQSEEIEKLLEESIKKTKEVKKDFKELKEKLREKKELDWQTKKDLEKLMERQKDIQQKMEDAKQNFQEKQKNEAMMEKSPQTQEKEERIEKMFDEIKKNEVDELMEKIRELMEELNKDQAQEMVQEMEKQDETLENELERLKELYKELEVEKDVEEFLDQMKKLAEEQEKLAEETKNKEKPQEQLKKEQEDIEKKLDDLKKDLEQIQKKNDELENPKDLGEENEEEMEDINQDMDEAQDKMDQNQNSKASEAQKKASKKMKDMASDMQSSMEAGGQDQMAEDMEMIRQLLENLVTLSFNQEDLINEFEQTNEHVPRFVELVQEQFRIKNDFTVVEDTLMALAKRQAKLETFVIEKMTEVQNNLDISITRLEERKKKLADENQRKSMKGLNDLALMLDEAMNQMQQQMASMSSGSKMCNKPNGKGQGKGKGKAPKDKISEGQKGLNKEMKEMLEKMKKEGRNSKPGKDGKKGKDGMAKEFAEAAAKQAALRKALEELKKENTEQGKGDNGLQKLIDEMDQIETDLVNRRLDAQMISRQNNILTRLLEAEKADRQREMDEKRKAERASNLAPKFPPALEKYLKQREAEVEQYKTVSPSLKPYYKYLVERYYNSLKTN